MKSSENNIKLVEYNRTFLDLSFKWLGDPEIRELTDTSVLKKEDHEAWFMSLAKRKDYKIWGIIYSGYPIGATGLKNIEKEKCEYFGYIGEKEFWNKGLSRQILNAVFEYARSKEIGRIWLRVLKTNTRAIAAYKKYGFGVFHEDLKFFYMDKPTLFENPL